jgi:hypothetical protein
MRHGCRHNLEEILAMGKPVVILKRWSFESHYYPYTHFLRGICIGHPRLPDGADIKTSEIECMQGREIETRNTIYILD